MSVWGKIAGRYLFSGKSGSVTGWISGISAAGMAVGSAALIIILSVYNGFDSIIRENLKKTRLEERATVVQADYSSWLKTCRQQYDLILLDPPYAEVFLETALKIVSEIDILTNSGIIVCERPYEKSLPDEIPGLARYRDYRYGKAAVTIFRRG